ncbi:MAG: hypothetical protein ACI9S9_004687 [Planctomycetota bacterium]|jgi:hypothetical protein
MRRLKVNSLAMLVAAFLATSCVTRPFAPPKGGPPEFVEGQGRPVLIGPLVDGDGNVLAGVTASPNLCTANSTRGGRYVVTDDRGCFRLISP